MNFLVDQAKLSEIFERKKFVFSHIVYFVFSIILIIAN